MSVADFFRNKRITVMGLGLLGRGVGDIAFLASQGADLIVTDLKSEHELAPSLERLRQFSSVRYTLGRHEIADFENRDFVLKAAGVPKDSIYVSHALARSIPVYMSTALFAALTSATIVGVTGTRGKTTVTGMIHRILSEAAAGGKRRVVLGGNIQGIATLPFVMQLTSEDIAVLELDSWQLQGFGELRISPKVAVFTTFMPDHLNYYKGDLADYFADKSNIYRFQRQTDICLVGRQVLTSGVAERSQFPPHVRYVSEEMLRAAVHLQIAGAHNRYNAAMAQEAALAMGVAPECSDVVLSRFTSVPGRLETVRSIRGVRFINDTTATTPHALIAALDAVGSRNNVVLIMGGADKGIELGGLAGPIQEKCKSVILLPGTGTQRLLREQIVPSMTHTYAADSMVDAVRQAVAMASSGDVVLLSPAFASFGLFANEYERGDQFRTDVLALAR